MPKLQLQVVVPCYNPREDWVAVLQRRFDALKGALPKVSIGLILVNDGSSKGWTKESLTHWENQPNVQVLQHPENRGKGAALRTGIEAATATHILVTDVDFPYTLDSMVSMYERLCSSGGVLAGQRGEAYYAKVPPFRRRLSQLHRRLIKFLFRLPVTDSQAGLKGFDAKGRALFLRTRIDRFLVDLEFLAMSREVVVVNPHPVKLREGIVFTDFGLQILKKEAGNFWHILLGSWFGW